jgi:hypothetical protein
MRASVVRPAALILAGFLVAVLPLSAIAHDQKTAPSFSAAQLAERTLHRRAVEAVIWGRPAGNYDLMLQEMPTKTTGKIGQVIYWGRPLYFIPCPLILPGIHWARAGR